MEVSVTKCECVMINAIFKSGFVNCCEFVVTACDSEKQWQM